MRLQHPFFVSFTPLRDNDGLGQSGRARRIHEEQAQRGEEIAPTHPLKLTAMGFRRDDETISNFQAFLPPENPFSSPC
jgi:hypothetical protein